MWRRAIVYALVPLTVTLFVTEMIVLAGADLVNPGGHPDPFAPYEAMMPGQLAMTLENPACDFQGVSGDGAVTHCERQPIDGFFASVSSNSYNGKFVFSSFIPNDVYIGDVIKRWGRPDVVQRLSDQSFYVLWYDHGLICIIDPVGPLGRFSYMLPIEHIIIALQPP